MPIEKLSDIDYLENYDSDDIIDDDQYFILNNFYIPSLSVSSQYDRLAGFFSSSSLTVAARGIAGLIKNNGHMRLITCQRLSKEDVESITKGESQDEIIKKKLLDEIIKDGKLVNESIEALGWMIANGFLEIRIVLMFDKDQLMDYVQIDESSIFHHKIGIFRDNYSNTVVFSGSINESAKAWTSNGENIDVYWSWDESVSSRINKKIKDFEKYWELGSLTKSTTITFPEAVSQKWIEYVPHDKSDLKIFKNNVKDSLYTIPDYIEQLEYQQAAVNNWANQGYKGLFDMATGTGKTKTALLACKRLSDDLKGNLAIIVVCPYLHLTEMWYDEFREFGITNIVVGHSQSNDWKNNLKRSLLLYNQRKTHFVLITTNNTFSSQFVQEKITQIKGNVLLICDEVHHMGSKNYLKTLNTNIPYRIGLSATIERFNDKEGTSALESYFGPRCITYSLEKALDEKMLTPYYYYPVICYFSDEEYSRIIEINDEIETLLLTNHPSDKARIEELRISGYNLIARMDDKIIKLIELINEHKNDYHMLIYCGATTIDNDPSEINPETGDSDASERLIQYISKSLYHHTNIDLKSFTYADTLANRKNIIDDFVSKKIQAIVSIRCLDEGLNVPNINSAFILSSSDDPKEYIQRRGRVLRKAANKPFATIYDFIAFPKSYKTRRLDNLTKNTEFTIIARELRRMYEFSRLANNPADSFDIIDSVSALYDEPNLREVLNGNI